MSEKEIEAAKAVIMQGCSDCDYDGFVDMFGCPKCKGMGNYFWMEQV